MKSVTHNGREFLFVEVPEDAHNFEIDEDGWFFYSLDYSIFGDAIKLPPGSYRILCKASEAGEEQAAVIVDSINPDGHKVCYRDYEGSPDEWLDRSDWFDTATESLHSLILSLGMEVGKTIILEKLK